MPGGQGLGGGLHSGEALRGGGASLCVTCTIPESGPLSRCCRSRVWPVRAQWPSRSASIATFDRFSPRTATAATVPGWPSRWPASISTSPAGPSIPAAPERASSSSASPPPILERGCRRPPRGEALTAAQVGLLERWIEEGASFQSHWAFVPPRSSQGAAACSPGACAQPGRRLRAQPAGLRRDGALARRWPPNPGPETESRPHRVAAEPSGIEAIRQRHPPRGVREARRPPARLPPTTASAWLRIGWTPPAMRTRPDSAADFPRPMWHYRDWIIEAFNSNMPLRPVHGRAAGRRHAARLHAVAEDRHGLSSELHAGPSVRIRRKRSFESRESSTASDTTGRVWLGPHHRLRGMPRPQVRSHQPARILSAFRDLQQHPPLRRGIRGPWPAHACGP